ncbi:MAG: hypothetical protein ABSC55_13645 [Syntrophorhabdales bacterium]|jgi:hypothetical protein
MTGLRPTSGDRQKPSMGESVQRTESQAAPGKSVVTGLCIECAMRHYDYREMLWRETGDDHFSETAFPQAWIDGRQYMLLSCAWTHQETCTECNRKAPSIYVRMT